MPNTSEHPSHSFQYPFWVLFVIVFLAALVAWEIRDQLQVKNYERAYETTTIDYQSGEATMFDVLAASRELEDAERRTWGVPKFASYERHIQRLQNDL